MHVYFVNTILSFCQNNEGKPLLLVAAEAGLTDIVAALLIAGADPNSVHSVCCIVNNTVTFSWGTS